LFGTSSALATVNAITQIARLLNF